MCLRFQTTDRVAFTWDPPRSDQRNGKITGYSVRFHKKGNMDHIQRLYPNETKVRPAAISTRLRSGQQAALVTPGIESG